MNELSQAYPALRNCWMVGAPAVGQAPAGWRDLVVAATPEQSEQAIVALAGQALDVVFRPEVPKGLEIRPDLPNLAKPVMPQNCRDMFGTAVKSMPIAPLLKLVDARGFTVHPLDWFPGATNPDVPSEYLPWQDWARGVVGATAGPDQLDDITWADTAPAERLHLLTALRAQNPSQARRLIAEHAGAERADDRQRLVMVLGSGLGPDDIEYLTSLLADRAGSVRSLAAALLGRLGVSSAGAAEVEELAGFFEVRRKLTGLSVTLANQKTRAQTKRWGELMGKCAVTDLAKGLNLTADRLVEAWRSSGEDGDAKMAQMVAASGTDGQVNVLAEYLIANRSRAVVGLFERLDAVMLRKALPLNLASDVGLENLFAMAPDLARPSDFAASKWVRSLRQSSAGDTAQRRRAIGALAFVATPSAAEALIDSLVDSGVRPREPMLAPLQLNVALAQAAQTATLTKETP